MTGNELPPRVRLAIAGALALDSIRAVLRGRPVDVDERGRPRWPGPVHAGDGPAAADTVWLASIAHGGLAHRWDDPAACMASTARRGGWTMPADAAAGWFHVTWCRRCWPEQP